MGYTDSLERLEGWIGRRIELDDNFFDYHSASIRTIEMGRTDGQIVAIMGLDGSRRTSLQQGVNLVQYSNGTAKIIMIK